jgi:hypothetical protein
MSLFLAMPELYRLGGPAARSVNRGGDSDRECAEIEIAPVANGRPHQTLGVPSDDARGRPDGVLPLPIDENRGMSRALLKFEKRALLFKSYAASAI